MDKETSRNGPYTVGARVRRGPDWKWGDQDGSGLGTVTEEKDVTDAVSVKWDNNGNTNNYRVGLKGKYDLEIVEDSQTNDFQFKRNHGQFEFGARVRRGPDWQWDDQDGAGLGTVVSKGRTKAWIWVRWDTNGKVNLYRIGAQGGKYDLTIVTAAPSAPPSEQRNNYSDSERSTRGPFNILARVRRGRDWMWEDQDSSGLGTIIGEGDKENWINILWDNERKNSYRIGADNKYDIVVVQDAPFTVPSFAIKLNRGENKTSAADKFAVGTNVKRGPDWMSGDQDRAGLGTVVGKHPSKTGWVYVRWGEDEVTRKYRVGADDKYDLAVVDDTLRSSSTQKKEGSDKKPKSSDFIFGARVTLSLDWKWENQDGSALGTIIKEADSDGWISVLWDKTNKFLKCPIKKNDKYVLAIVNVAAPSSLPLPLMTENQVSDTKPKASDFIFGARVTRGPDWTSENQDGSDLGTIVRKPNSDGLALVLWDKTQTIIKAYRAGKDNKYDLAVVHGAAPPPLPVPLMMENQDSGETPKTSDFIVGARVTRGPDWKWENQDGSGLGTIVRKPDSDGWASVIWDKTKTFNKYRAGKDNKYDLAVVDGASPSPLPLPVLRRIQVPRNWMPLKLNP